MTVRDLARRSLRHYWRSHAGVLAGATVAAAVLIGALAVGDSVKGSLAQRARERMGFSVVAALDLRDRFITTNLPRNLAASLASLQEGTPKVGDLVAVPPPARATLVLPAIAIRQDGAARANQTMVYGVSAKEFFHHGSPAAGETWLSESLAGQLRAVVGDDVVLRIHKPAVLSRDAVITPRDDQSVALRLRVGRILSGREGGNFSLQANQTPPLNAFVPYETLAIAAGLNGHANLVLAERLFQLRSAGFLERAAFKEGELIHSGWAAARNNSMNFSSRPLTEAEQAEAWQDLLASAWSLADAELSVRSRNGTVGAGGEAIPSWVELISRRIFLEPATVAAALAVSTNAPLAGAKVAFPEPTPILTYLVNSLRGGDRLTPYSMVTAAGSPYTPADLKDDEIVVNEWLARDLGVKPGDLVQLTYYRADAGARLEEHTNAFRVRSIVPLRGLHGDRTLMPEFPGLTKAESTRDWDAGFDLVHPIRDQDEAYWKQWRGTPKAFISLEAGRKLWANRFGDLTAVRWFVPEGVSLQPVQETVATQVRAGLKPSDLGLVWQPVAERARIAASTGQDFGGLFLGFSFFLMAAALLLMAMLFQFAVEERATEVGLLLALGFESARVRRLFLREGMMLAALGTFLGAVLGVGYARGILWGLSTIWNEAVAGAGLEFHLTLPTMLIGATLGFAAATGTMWLALRKQAQRPARVLLNHGSVDLPWSTGGGAGWWGTGVAVASGVAALGLAGAGWLGQEQQQPGLFFGAGALVLTAGALGIRSWLRRRIMGSGSVVPRSLSALAWRGLARRPSRSLGTILLLACASFLLVVVAANRLDAGRRATERSSGTGGFAFWAESTLPVIQDLNTSKGREFFGLDPAAFAGVSVVPFRVRDGDDASCLNLNRAQQPRILGVDPDLLARRGAFTFTALAPGVTVTNGWLALLADPGGSTSDVPEIPAIGDANSIQWALGRKVGDTLDFMDERGRPFRVRLVGAVANSILQGNLVVAESSFVRLFPSESGHRVFLVDAPAGQATAVSAAFTRALLDTGLQMTPATERLGRFNSVQNTYLNTFQVLGGLGLLLGSVGLGVVVLRNVQERRGELALMQAVGFEPRAVRRLVLSEHAMLLILGLGLGGLAAVIAVLPTVLRPGSGIPWGSLAVTLLLVLINGLVWTWIATRRTLSGDLMSALREL